MVDLTIREAACPHDASLLWDTRWNQAEGAGEWRMAGADEPINFGGLAASHPFETSAVNLLFTDRRCPPDHPLAKHANGDLRGWWGDTFRQAGEEEDGSLLWLVVARGLCDAEAVRWTKVLAEDALQPLVRVRAVSRVLCAAEAFPERNLLTLQAQLFGSDGKTVFDQRFEHFWGAMR